jgi:hypothetical protein
MPPAPAPGQGRQSLRYAWWRISSSTRLTNNHDTLWFFHFSDLVVKGDNKAQQGQMKFDHQITWPKLERTEDKSMTLAYFDQAIERWDQFSATSVTIPITIEYMCNVEHAMVVRILYRVFVCSKAWMNYGFY